MLCTAVSQSVSPIVSVMADSLPGKLQLGNPVCVIIADGSMEDLDGKWILAKDTACPEKDASPATLGLPNMAGGNICHSV